MNINRNIINKLHSDRKLPQATILTGPRQVGKTTLLRVLEKMAKKEGKKTAFFDLEQPMELALFNREDAEILKLLSQAGDIIFIDEFHYLKNSSHLFKALFDKKAPIKIYASGSSAMEIHSHLKESLAGRKFIYHIYPCSYEEMGQVIKDPFFYISVYGGMPGTIHFESSEKKKEHLADILQSYLLKDIKSLIREENIRAFNHLLYLLAERQGSVVSIESLAIEVKLSPHTISSYLDILEQTYVNFALHSYSRNFGNELKKSKKHYLYDLGIRNALLRNFAPLGKRKDAGAIAESFVFHELQKHLSPETEIRFWRLKGGVEVDFIWIKNQEAYPIEVKLNWKVGEIPKGLQTYLRRYPETQKAFVVSQLSKKDPINFQGALLFYKSFEEVFKIPDMCE